MEDLDFDFLANELMEKARSFPKLGARLKFVFTGEGAVHIDATGETPVVSLDEAAPADVIVTAPRSVWLDLRAKRLAPHVAAMTGKMKIKGDVTKFMKLAPRIMLLL